MKDPNNPIFARRTARNWSRAHLAKLVGASTRSIQLWETNRRIPNHEHAVKLAEVFGCRPSRFQAPEAGEQVGRYSDLMAESQGFVVHEILSSYFFDEHRCVLDVGAGKGRFVSELARHAPHLDDRHRGSVGEHDRHL